MMTFTLFRQIQTTSRKASQSPGKAAAMALPTLHSFQWSDTLDEGNPQSRDNAPRSESPASLKDKELHVWVVYPDIRQTKRKANSRKSRRKDLKLWAVLILEDLKQTGDFTYKVKMRRIFKQGDRWITVWVRNDPNDQSEEADVFGLISPDSKLLSPLEQFLANMAAKRV